MTNIPRRLPPTQGQRIRNVTVTHASLSGQGRTAAARPVPQSRPANRIYQPPTTSNVVTGESGIWSTAIESTVSGGAGEVWATGEQSVALGRDAQAYGSNSVAIGFSQASAFGGVAIGLNTVASGPGSVAIGNAGTLGASAAGEQSIAIGGQAAANGANSVAIGRNATAGDDQIVLGRLAHTVIVPGALVIGDGTGAQWRLVVSGGALSLVAYP